MGNGLVVNTNVAALNTTRVLQRSTFSLNRSLERLSSGLRINRAADDAAGLAIAESLRSQVKGAQVASRNAQDGISLLQIAEGALSEITNVMQRIRELAVQSANGTNSVQNRSDLQAEVVALRGSVQEILDRTEFNGLVLFSNLGGAITLQTGADAGATTTIATIGAAAFTTTDLQIATADIATQAGASTAITNVDIGLVALNQKRAALGAAQNGLQFTTNVLGIQEENSLAAESAIRDADIARETIAFTRAQILVSAGTSILSQANIVPQTALQLLG
jgi:flagellin